MQSTNPFTAQRVPDGFHHEHKSKGVAIATDIDDGAPAAYDLPEPTTAGALAPTAPPKDKSGQPITNGVSGAFTDDDEEARWIERAGWAPRFGDGKKGDEGEGESLLDHQTWVEGRLEDKFYGGKHEPRLETKESLTALLRLVSQYCCDHICLSLIMACGCPRGRARLGLSHNCHLWHILSHFNTTSATKFSR